MKDIVVVGGGPAGSAVAGMLAGSGYNVTVIEKHSEPGLPAHCAGLVTENTARFFGKDSDVLSRIRKADVVFPGGRIFNIDAHKTMAVVLDRRKLDADLANKAEDAGAQYQYNERASLCYASDSEMILRTDRGEYESNLLIGADGQCSKISASLKDNCAREYISGMIMDIKKCPEHSDTMTLRLGRKIAPGFFSWELPMGDVTRVGLCVESGEGTPKEYLKKLIHEQGYDGYEAVGTYAGKIPLGGRRTIVGDRTMLIGDAAGQVKPISGGGLCPISEAAPMLKNTVDRAFSLNKFDRDTLFAYESEWQRARGRSMRNGYRIRTWYTGLDDKGLDRAGELVSDPKIKKVFEDTDLDNPCKIMRPAMATPRTAFGFARLILRSKF